MAESNRNSSPVDAEQSAQGSTITIPAFDPRKNLEVPESRADPSWPGEKLREANALPVVLEPIQRKIVQAAGITKVTLLAASEGVCGAEDFEPALEAVFDALTDVLHDLERVAEANEAVMLRNVEMRTDPCCHRGDAHDAH